MILFVLGFLTAIALVAIGVIVLALRSYYRQERQRQASVDAIMAKVVSGAISVNEARSEGQAKGVH